MNEKILILSEDNDYHGTAVMWGLSQLGEGKRIVYWDRTRFPVKQRLSTALSTKGSLSFRGNGLSDLLRPNRFRSIWNRRGADPTVDEKLNKADKIVAKTESKFFLSSTLSAIERMNRDALVVNSNAASMFADEKLVQLMLASSIGMQIPPTLISNTAADIRGFFRDHEGAVIAKQHCPFAWRSAANTVAVPGTSLITEEHIESKFSLEGSPVIYQRLLDIEHELRVTVFGRSVFAISQKRVPANFGGIRDIRWEDPIPQRYDLPPELSEKLFVLMSLMGLSFATFDIAVTKQDEFVFLECNEAGQFLFQEVRVPELNLLDAFCRYLASGDKDFEYKSAPSAVKLSAFEGTEIAMKFHKSFTEKMRKSARYSPFELME